MNAIWTHALTALIALAVGIPIGWLLREGVKEEMRSMDKKWYRKVGLSGVIGIVVAAVTAVALVAMVISISGLRDETRCQKAFNDATQSALVERARAGNLDREVLQLSATSTVTMLDAILRPSTQAQRISAVKAWRTAQADVRDKLAEAEKIREANPLPESPTC